MEPAVIRNAEAYILELFSSDAGGHDAGHTLRVLRNARRLMETELDCDRNVVELAALLHDVDDHKLFKTKDYANARGFLQRNNVPDEKAERIIRAIASVSFSQNRGEAPDTLEGKIVQDADRLDAMGAIGVARTFAFGGEHKRPLEASVQHFHDKLLRLKDLMNTEAGKRMAQERHAFLEAFLEQYIKETGEDSGRKGNNDD